MIIKLFFLYCKYFSFTKFLPLRDRYAESADFLGSGGEGEFSYFTELKVCSVQCIGQLGDIV